MGSLQGVDRFVHECLQEALEFRLALGGLAVNVQPPHCAVDGCTRRDLVGETAHFGLDPFEFRPAPFVRLVRVEVAAEELARAHDVAVAAHGIGNSCCCGCVGCRQPVGEIRERLVGGRYACTDARAEAFRCPVGERGEVRNPAMSPGPRGELVGRGERLARSGEYPAADALLERCTQ